MKLLTRVCVSESLSLYFAKCILSSSISMMGCVKRWSVNSTGFCLKTYTSSHYQLPENVLYVRSALVWAF